MKHLRLQSHTELVYISVYAQKEPPVGPEWRLGGVFGVAIWS